MKKGFTLVELLVVIVIIGILAAVIFVALDPAQRFGDARDARRWQEVRSILDAVIKYQVDNGGTLPGVIPSGSGNAIVLGTDTDDATCVCSGGTGTEDCLDLSGTLVDGYLAAIPVDPSTGTDAITRYYIYQSTGGRITVGACDAEYDTVTVSR